MKKIVLMLTAVVFVSLITPEQARGQILEIKKWTGTYPDMEGTYPLSFISFTGWLIPLPHVFLRTWPTHYYVEVGAMPVTDAIEIAGATQTGLLRLAAKMLERYQVKGRHEETTLIKENTDFQKQIEEKIFNARADQLEDLFRLTQGFIELYKKVETIGQLPNSAHVKKILHKEADHLLMRFLMVNLLQSDHGEKLKAFSEISTLLNKQLGEADYTWSKIRFFSNYGKEQLSYSFLIR